MAIETLQNIVKGRLKKTEAGLPWTTSDYLCATFARPLSLCATFARPLPLCATFARPNTLCATFCCPSKASPFSSIFSKTKAILYI